MHDYNRALEMDRVLVVGYYDKGNLGDDAFKTIMRKLFPKKQLDFCGSDVVLEIKDTSVYSSMIVGPGDVINDYFNDSVTPFMERFKGPKMAFGVGIPFDSCISADYLQLYDHVFTRNIEDVRAIQRVVGSERAHFVPEITLSYESPERSISPVSIKKCGVFLIGNVIDHPRIVDDITTLLGRVSRDYAITFYTFNPSEDTIISNIIKFNLSRSYKCEYGVDIDAIEHTPEDMISIMATLDLSICMRYHAHVFAVVAKCPLLSISTTKKTKSFMRQARLSRYQYQVPLDDYGTPIDSNSGSMIKIFKRCIKKNDMIDRMRRFLNESRFLLDSVQAQTLLSEDDWMNNNNIDPTSMGMLISKKVMGCADTGYVWGISDKLTRLPRREVLSQSIDYLSKQNDKYVDPYVDPCVSKLPIYVDLSEYQSYRGAHRGGWYDICKVLHARSSVNDLGRYNGVLIDMYVDRTFHWAKEYMKASGIIPYTSPWCGIIHHTQDTVYSMYNATALFANLDFLRSLTTCRALFTLSEPLSRFVSEMLKLVAPHVIVGTLIHPVVMPTIEFSVDSYADNTDKSLINIGAWMRNPFTIYRLPKFSAVRKCVLIGKAMEGYLPPHGFTIKREVSGSTSSTLRSFDSSHPCRDHPCRDHPCRNHPCRDHPCRDHTNKWIMYLIEWLKSHGLSGFTVVDNTLYVKEGDVERYDAMVRQMISEVSEIPFKSNDEYDDLLSDNIVFLDLIDAAAVNTIIECIVRNTPVIVNRIPGTVHLLGKKYPLFYDNLNQVEGLLTIEKISKAHRYLRSVNKSKYTIDHFVSIFKDWCSSIDR